MYSQLIVAAALAAFAPAALADQCARTYSVQVGDYCDKISAAQKVSTFQLAVVNTAINTDCTNLNVGQNLCLGNTGEDCSTVHVVALGDTCDDISAQNSLNATILRLNNPQINDDCTNIYVGEVLCVSGTVQVPPTPAGPIPAATIPPGATPASPSATAVASSSTSTPAPAQTTTPPADGDDDDCDDDEGDDQSSAPPPAQTTAAPAQTTAPPADGAGDDQSAPDDEDLPFCDEE